LGEFLCFDGKQDKRIGVFRHAVAMTTHCCKDGFVMDLGQWLSRSQECIGHSEAERTMLMAIMMGD